MSFLWFKTSREKLISELYEENKKISELNGLIEKKKQLQNLLGKTQSLTDRAKIESNLDLLIKEIRKSLRDIEKAEHAQQDALEKAREPIKYKIMDLVDKYNMDKVDVTLDKIKEGLSEINTFLEQREPISILPRNDIEERGIIAMKDDLHLNLKANAIMEIINKHKSIYPKMITGEVIDLILKTYGFKE